MPVYMHAYYECNMLILAARTGHKWVKMARKTGGE